MKYHFDEKIACQVGVEAAILYSNLDFWCEKNAANNKGFYDGYYWTYNSAEAFAKLFPFWSKDKIYRLLEKLKEVKLIKVGNYNKAKYDQTRWYTTLRENAELHFAESQNGNDESAEPIPNKKPNKKHNINSGEESPLVSEIDLALSEKLMDGIIKNCESFRQKYELENENSQKPQVLISKINKWALDIEKMRRLDHREASQIEFMIAWIFGGEIEGRKLHGDLFWQPNIQSGKKLREKWDVLVGQIKRKITPQNSKKVNQALKDLGL